MPAFQVASAGETFIRASALPKRAPSICTARPCAWRELRERRDLLDPVDRAALGRLRDRQRRGIDLMRNMAGIARDRGRSTVPRVSLAVLARQADQLDAAAEEFRRAAFVGHDVCLLVAQHAAPGRRDMGKREGVGGGPGGHQEDRDLASRTVRRSAARPTGSARRCRSRAQIPHWRGPARPGCRARWRRYCRLRNSPDIEPLPKSVGRTSDSTPAARKNGSRRRRESACSGRPAAERIKSGRMPKIGPGRLLSAAWENLAKLAIGQHYCPSLRSRGGGVFEPTLPTRGARCGSASAAPDFNSSLQGRARRRVRHRLPLRAEIAVRTQRPDRRCEGARYAGSRMPARVSRNERHGPE